MLLRFCPAAPTVVRGACTELCHLFPSAHSPSPSVAVAAVCDRDPEEDGCAHTARGEGGLICCKGHTGISRALHGKASVGSYRHVCIWIGRTHRQRHMTGLNVTDSIIQRAQRCCPWGMNICKIISLILLCYALFSVLDVVDLCWRRRYWVSHCHTCHNLGKEYGMSDNTMVMSSLVQCSLWCTCFFLFVLRIVILMQTSFTGLWHKEAKLLLLTHL